MSDWSRTQRAIKTPNGTIYYGGPCNDRYQNFEKYDQGGGHNIFFLQRPAMKAFKAAEERYRAKTNPNKFINVLAGTNRSCSLQTSLYRSDSSRYAAPQYTGHTRGLAIDVSQAQPNLQMIYTALANEHWKRARSDEPWHWSYFVEI